MGMSPDRFCISFVWTREPCLASASATSSPRLPMTVKYGRLLLAARACAVPCLENGQPEVSPRLASRVAPSLAMSNDVAAERSSQPAQRDELAHSHTVPIGDGASPLTIDNPPNATTGILESLKRP